MLVSDDELRMGTYQLAVLPVQPKVSSGVSGRICVHSGLVLFDKVAEATSGSAHLSCAVENLAL